MFRWLSNHSTNLPPQAGTGLPDGVVGDAEHVCHFMGAELEFFQGEVAKLSGREVGVQRFLLRHEIGVRFFKQVAEAQPVFVGEDGALGQLFEVLAPFTRGGKFFQFEAEVGSHVRFLPETLRQGGEVRFGGTELGFLLAAQVALAVVPAVSEQQHEGEDGEGGIAQPFLQFLFAFDEADAFGVFFGVEALL